MKIIFSVFLLLSVFSFAAFAQTENNLDKGIELYRQSEYAKAAEVLQKTVKTDAKDRLAWLYLGASFFKLNKNKDAVNAFNKSDGYYKQNQPVDDKKAKIISKPRASSSNSAVQDNISGSVEIAAELSADGTIGFIFPFQTLPDGLTENAIKAAKSIKFEPAVKNGKSVTTVITVEYTFSSF